MFVWNKILNAHSVKNAHSGYSLMRSSYNIFLQTFPRAPGRLARYDIAIVSSGITLFVCLFLNHALGGNFSLTPFIIPVVMSAWFGGLGPGLLATLLSGLVSEYFLTKPHFSLFSMDTADWERLTLFLATSGLMNWLILMMRAARQEVEAKARDAVQALRINQERLNLSLKVSRAG